MSFNFFKSTDASAPVLNGQSGSLLGLLRALLVGTAGIAYGTKASAGWTEPFTGINKAIFLTPDGACYYRVLNDNSQGGTNGSSQAVVRGAEGATDVDTLVDPFPTVAQVANDLCVWRASSDTTATARPWQAVVTPGLLMLTISNDGTSSDLHLMGAYSANQAANAWAYLVNSRGPFSWAPIAAGKCAINSLTVAFTSKMFAMRAPEGAIKSVRADLFAPSSDFNNEMGRSGPTAPLQNGAIDIQKVRVMVNRGTASTNVQASVAGLVPNLWEMLHGGVSGIDDADTFTVPTDALSAEYLIRRLSVSNAMMFAWETTDTWAHG